MILSTDAAHEAERKLVDRILSKTLPLEPKSKKAARQRMNQSLRFDDKKRSRPVNLTLTAVPPRIHEDSHVPHIHPGLMQSADTTGASYGENSSAGFEMINYVMDGTFLNPFARQDQAEKSPLMMRSMKESTSSKASPRNQSLPHNLTQRKIPKAKYQPDESLNSAHQKALDSTFHQLEERINKLEVQNQQITQQLAQPQWPIVTDDEDLENQELTMYASDSTDSFEEHERQAREAETQRERWATFASGENLEDQEISLVELDDEIDEDLEQQEMSLVDIDD